MGLTHNSVGRGAANTSFTLEKQDKTGKIVALAGNPNVGKSTLFNNLTGLNQHTGNWSGKTVANAKGFCKTEKNNYVFVDIPGTYSLMAHSAEEECARDFICFGEPDAVVVVCDATCLERNLNLVLQTMEISRRVIVCINLMDEAKRKGIEIDEKGLSDKLGTAVTTITARKKASRQTLLDTLDKFDGESDVYRVEYCEEIETALAILQPAIHKKVNGKISERWLALKLIDPEPSLLESLKNFLETDITEDKEVKNALTDARQYLHEKGFTPEAIKDKTVSAILSAAEDICKDTVLFKNEKHNSTDRKLDKLLTGKLVGYPVMLLLLTLIFFITIIGANYPSNLLSAAFKSFENVLNRLLVNFGTPEFLRGLLVDGMYRVLSWVVAVMLPPMAIFFPLFTLLEDVGYLPRIAYNLDKPFKCCKACGKQALTMCMGFGCNAAGIVGCRIIDSPRERLLAILTNSFVPCNGRFPALISMITMFFVGFSGSFGASILSALILTAAITLGVVMTLLVTRLLSETLLKGVPSSFTLEMPPYRRPQILKVLMRSVLDRTLFVLGRAAAVAAPAGILLWISANINCGGVTLLTACADFLDPFAHLIGLDGVILIAFILGFPANEIVIPIIIMAYTASGTLTDITDLAQLKILFTTNGWTWVTALCVMTFSLMHWPCSTTLITVKKETGSLKWTVLSAAIPTFFGMLCCFLINTVARLL